MFKVGDIIKIVDKDRTYDTYLDYFNFHNIEHLKQYFKMGKMPKKTSKYKIIFTGEHEDVGLERMMGCTGDLCVIQDLETEQVFIMYNNEKALKMV